MVNIIDRLPLALTQILQNATWSLSPAPHEIGPVRILLLFAFFLAIVVGVIFITQGQRRIPIQQAKHTFYTLMSALAVVFLLIIVSLNIMLRAIVIRPVVRMSKLAEQISTGDIEGTEFDERGRDEIGKLAASFNRMRRSLEKAFKMLDE